jgi:EAL domain-containing protein (putative c-di-GMP-specific phosphodiesterase class I)
METLLPQEPVTVRAEFGRRKIAPRVCIADSKPHIRRFLRDALEELGFVVSDLAGDVPAFVAEKQFDLIVLGLSAGGIEASHFLEQLAAVNFEGQILVFGPRTSLMAEAIVSLGGELGLRTLPLLPTPFSDRDLRARIAELIPTEAPPHPPVDITEALHANWLELWYQPKIEARSLMLSGAEALVRMRHPSWGTVPPAYFIPDEDDPHFGALSDFVTSRAITDWHYFVSAHGPVEIAINLPARFFENPNAIETLARQLPDHPAFEGLIVEIDSHELVRDLRLSKKIARQLQLHNIGISIDDLGAEWPLLLELDEFPFVEIKVDRTFVTGCSNDRLKQSTCRRILELADGFGARTVAEGIETRADFLMARELGFDLIQGFFFAKPMEPDKFAQRILNRPVTIPS